VSEETPPTRTRGPSLALRRARLRQVSIVLGATVGLPTLLATVYFVGMATPEYESVTLVTVESGEPPGEPSRGAVRARAAMADHDLQIARNHMLSRDVLGALAKRHRFVEHYRRADPGSRLSRHAGSEDAYEYYRSKVTIGPETKSGTLELHVRAFSAKAAHDFSRAIAEQTGGLFDRLSRRARRETLARADQTIEDARARLAAAGETGLEAEVARQEMAAALRARELAEVEAVRRERSLAIVAGPSLPDRPSYPRRGYAIVTVFVTSLVGTGILWLLGAAVREHSRFS
jgi:capsular polysaccharide transport system permease protein